MEGSRERAYAIRDGILYSVVSSRMNQVNELKSAQVGAPMSMGRASKTRLQRRGVKQSGEIDIEFKIVEYTICHTPKLGLDEYVSGKSLGGGVEMLCRIWWGGDERGMVMDGDDEAVVGRLGTWRSSKVVA
ncbi:hypothetical protein Tco_0706904 [Tanacetum coccineum]|uniref:Uncharacterized protein n=1 Tax=Tanacetum coccineum TaxID=301880 RepID=A0ABQ4YAB5_9ASTR